MPRFKASVSGREGEAPAEPPIGHPSVRRRHVVASSLLLVVLLALTGCADHPPLQRPSYDLAKALYAACNRQSIEHLAKFDEVLAAAIAAGEVGPQEEAALRQIAQEAAAGEWYDAQEMARELIASQNS